MNTVTVVITTHNYGEFVEEAIASAKAQTIPVDIIVVDDGSTDNTFERLLRINDIRCYHIAHRGLAAAANFGIAQANTRYIIRLDADDVMDPHCCEMMANFLDRNLKKHAVYSDYWSMDETGQKGYMRQEKVEPHPACMMIWKQAFTALGGYNESLPKQEGHDFWLRFSERYESGYINLPLWTYRQHKGSMSTDWNARIRTRQGITEQHEYAPKVLTVIPARGGSKGIPRKNLREVGGVPLVARAINIAKKCGHDMFIVVSTEDEEIAALAKDEGVDVIPRPDSLALDDVSAIAVYEHAMKWKDCVWRADIVVAIQPTDPFTPPAALAEALEMMNRPDVTSVVSVAEITHPHPYRTYFLQSDKLLTPIFPEYAESFLQRQDRPTAYRFTGGFYVRRRELLEQWDGKDFALGKNCYGVVVPEEAGIDIDTPLDLVVARAIANRDEAI